MRNQNQFESALNEQINQQLDQEAAELDRRLAGKFAQARQRALEAMPDKANKTRSLLIPWLATGSIAAGALLAVLLIAPARETVTDEFETLMALANSEELEMLEQEPEFYIWLESEDLIDNG